MDKVKQILEFLRKYHFWILCVVAALVGLLVWNSASGKLDAQFKRDAANIDSVLTKVKGIQSPHPNETWNEGITKKTDALRQEVAGVWKDLYKQEREQVYVWPQALGKEFLDAVAALESNPEQTLSEKLRERYQNLIKSQAGALAGIVDAPPVESGAGGGDANSDLAGHRVRWSQLGDIQASFDWEDAPPTQMILYMQEELWVYEALCKVIKSVNDVGAGSHDTPIASIEEMAIAYVANTDEASTSKRILHPGKTAPAEPAATDAAKAPRLEYRTRGSKEARPQGTGVEGEVADAETVWKNYRYVKDTGEPMMATDLAGASAEYNLMPFRLKLVINPRDIDRLLVAFRNSVLPIEVRQVRINPGFSSGRSSAERTGPELLGNYQKVEISGVVYLIKPFNPQALGIAPAEPAAGEPAVGEPGTEAAGAAGGAAPAAAPAPPRTEQPAAGEPPAEQPAAAAPPTGGGEQPGGSEAPAPAEPGGAK